jgi:hypothetical protein
MLSQIRHADDPGLSLIADMIHLHLYRRYFVVIFEAADRFESWKLSSSLRTAYQPLFSEAV